MKICFLLAHFPNPRINKRIELLKQTADISVVCVRRAGLYSGETAENVRYEIFDYDFPNSKQLIKRYVVSSDFRKKALEKLYEIEPNVIYAEAMDCLLIAGEYKRRRNVHIVYEVPDLRRTYIEKPNDPVKRVITELLLIKERREFRNVELLTVTSPKFYDAHFSTLISRDRMIYIPNAPEKELFQEYKKKNSGEFTVGFIGGIRYAKQMIMLIDGADMAKCKAFFAGGISSREAYAEIQEHCLEKDFVTFTGEYDYNCQIAELYGRVDCVYSVYDADDPNVRIALPNKLYESILCELPIISARGTYLGELTEQWGVGLTVSHTDASELCEALKKLRDDKELYASIVENCRAKKDSISSEKTNASLLKAIEEMA